MRFSVSKSASLCWLLLLVAVHAPSAEPGYIDPARCRTCHEKIFDSYQANGMGRSFSKVEQAPALAEYFHPASERFYAVVQRGDTSFMRRWIAGGTHVVEKSIDFAVGSGNHSKTFFHLDARGKLLQLPLSWYAERGGYWAMSPGYDRPDHSDFRREASDSCLFCHNGYPSEANKGLANGIDCQRCHGPGEDHVKRRGSIVNPAKLSPDRSMEVCLQCHLESASRTLPDAIRNFDRGPFSYRPGEPLANFIRYFQFLKTPDEDRITVNNSAYGLRQSPCFLESGGRLQCTTCHDPHQKAGGAGAEQRYTSVCRSCHASTHEPRTQNCTNCHMQKRRTEDAVHVSMTDHRIRRQPLPGDLLAPIAERHGRHTGPVKPLYPERPAQTPEERLYLAMAQVQAGADPQTSSVQLAAALSAVQPKSAEPYAVLGVAYRRMKRDAAAAQAFRSALRFDANHRGALVGLAEVLAGHSSEEAIAMITAALRRLPGDPTLLNSLAVLETGRGHFDKALALVSRAIQSNGEDPLSWLNMGVCLEAKGDLPGAAAAYRQALVLQPDLQRAQTFLNRITSPTPR